MDISRIDPVNTEGRFPASMFLKNGILLKPFVSDHPEASKILKYLYLRLYDAGLMRRVFNRDLKEEWFVEYFSSKSNLLIYFIDLEKQDVVGFAWLNDQVPGRAAAHFCFFPWSWGGQALRAAKMGIRYWLDGLEVKLLYGVVHSDNHTALSFVKRLGWSVCGRIPGWGGRDNGTRIDGVVVAYEEV